MVRYSPEQRPPGARVGSGEGRRRSLGEGPALEIFDDFAALSRRATVAYYQHNCEINLQRVQLLPFDAVADETGARVVADLAAKDFFHGLLTCRTMLILYPGDLWRPPAREQLAEEWRDAQRRQLVALPGAEKLIREMLEADARDLDMARVKTLLKAGFKLKAGLFSLAKPNWDAAQKAQDEARRTIDHRRDKLAAIRTATRDRLITALSAYSLQPPPSELPTEARAEIEGLVRIVSRFDKLTGALLSLRNEVAGFEIVLANMPKEGTRAISNTCREMGASMMRATELFIEAAAGSEYPFDHAQGKVLLSKFLVETGNHGDESVHAYFRARTLIERFFSLYHRIHGRLTQLALQAEQNVLSPMAQPELPIPTA